MHLKFLDKALTGLVEFRPVFSQQAVRSIPSGVGAGFNGNLAASGSYELLRGTRTGHIQVTVELQGFADDGRSAWTAKLVGGVEIHKVAIFTPLGDYWDDSIQNL